jgi:hypothetical protein
MHGAVCEPADRVQVRLMMLCAVVPFTKKARRGTRPGAPAMHGFTRTGWGSRGSVLRRSNGHRRSTTGLELTEHDHNYGRQVERWY